MVKKFKDGGTIKNWQVHHLTITPDQANEMGYDVQMDECIVISGTVVDDPTGRWQPGFHMRTSMVRRLNRDARVCETQNTIYKLEGEEGKDCLPDLGDNIGKIFY